MQSVFLLLFSSFDLFLMCHVYLPVAEKEEEADVLLLGQGERPPWFSFFFF